MSQSLSELLKGYPAARAISAQDVRAAHAGGSVLVVLDDDPTGTQSVTGLPVITSWEEADFQWAFSQGAPAIYVMTNSRSLSPEAAERINREVARNARVAARAQGLELGFVSRSDSTLRGHFPLEPQTLIEEETAAGHTIDGVLIIPAFGDAGRITVGGVHYAGSEESGFEPVGASEFAQDATFGYSASNLCDWVEEKTHGKTPAAEVAHLDLTTIREGRAAELLGGISGGRYVACDAVTEEDLRAVALGVIESGKNFIYRVGPPFVRAFIGQELAAPLTAEDIPVAAADRGGLVVVGSHVPTTTRQLAALLKERETTVIELDAATVLNHGEGYLDELIERVDEALKHSTVVFHTSRQLIKGKDKDESLAIARRVSEALVGVVNGVVHKAPPAFVIAKGGITSSDVASKGLEMRRATVVGPMQPGIISLWAAQDGPAQGTPYIVFAGNVGSDTSLSYVVGVCEQAAANNYGRELDND